MNHLPPPPLTAFWIKLNNPSLKNLTDEEKLVLLRSYGRDLALEKERKRRMGLLSVQEETEINDEVNGVEVVGGEGKEKGKELKKRNSSVWVVEDDDDVMNEEKENERGNGVFVSNNNNSNNGGSGMHKDQTKRLLTRTEFVKKRNDLTDKEIDEWLLQKKTQLENNTINNNNIHNDENFNFILNEIVKREHKRIRDEEEKKIKKRKEINEYNNIEKKKEIENEDINENITSGVYDMHGRKIKKTVFEIKDQKQQQQQKKKRRKKKVTVEADGEVISDEGGGKGGEGEESEGEETEEEDESVEEAVKRIAKDVESSGVVVDLNEIRKKVVKQKEQTRLKEKEDEEAREKERRNRLWDLIKYFDDFVYKFCRATGFFYFLCHFG
jgi:hypothetical protein